MLSSEADLGEFCKCLGCGNLLEICGYGCCHSHSICTGVADDEHWPGVSDVADRVCKHAVERRSFAGLRAGLPLSGGRRTKAGDADRFSGPNLCSAVFCWAEANDAVGVVA